MIRIEKIRKIAKQLLEKTKLQQVNWLPNGANESSCVLKLDKSLVRITYLRPDTAPDFVRLEILRTGSETAVNAVATMEAPVNSEDFFNRNYTQQEVDDAELLTGLYSEATSVAHNWNELLEDINSALSKPGVVGTPL